MVICSSFTAFEDKPRPTSRSGSFMPDLTPHALANAGLRQLLMEIADPAEAAGNLAPASGAAQALVGEPAAAPAPAACASEDAGVRSFPLHVLAVIGVLLRFPRTPCE